MTGRATPADLEGQQLAAIDLGSNSFHLLVARIEAGGMHVIDRLREPVRLAAGIGPDKCLSAEAMVHALACLERFGERVRGMPPGTVRAVGTNTLRRARNATSFLWRAERALGHPIEIIAGREEARLIYCGVAHGLAGPAGRRLVVDIGGGSTELIVGTGDVPSLRESLFMGCVGISRAFFADGRVDKPRLRAASLAARQQLEPVEARFRRGAWETAIGCSGTIKAVAAIARAEGWVKHGITRSALQRLRRALVAAGTVSRVELRELGADRRAVLAGGVAVLSAVFEALDIEHMMVSDMALREGLIFDQIGRIRHQDVRQRTVERIGERFSVDRVQAGRVEASALALFDAAGSRWQLADGDHDSLLRWAARLHEIGLSVSHQQYHKHGGYLLANADLAGFSRQEQAQLAALVRGHRRKFPQGVFAALAAERRLVAPRLCVLLRLAVVLHRARGGVAEGEPALAVDGPQVRLEFAPGWLDGHPLLAADIGEESAYLAHAGFDLSCA